MTKSKIFLVALALAGATSLSACTFDFGTNNKGEKQFGDFAYRGNYLTEHAIGEISASEAKSLIEDNEEDRSTSNELRRGLFTSYDEEVEEEVPEVDLSSTINKLLYNYSGIVTTIKYYVDTSEAQQVKQEMYQGTEFNYLLHKNSYEPFGQMVVHYLYVNDGLIDYMEAENAKFTKEGRHFNTPFNSPYTYHYSDSKELIIQIHHFVDLPASITGGIGSFFKEDSELVFDKEGKIAHWQSSLGLYTSTPTGTLRQGYIFESDFEWNRK